MPRSDILGWKGVVTFFLLLVLQAYYIMIAAIHLCFGDTPLGKKLPQNLVAKENTQSLTNEAQYEHNSVGSDWVFLHMVSAPTAGMSWMAGG
jgi:hypothetical protein